LVLFELAVEQTVSQGVSEPTEAPTVSEDLLESDEVQTGSGIVPKPSGVLSRAEDSPDPVFEGVSVSGETDTGSKLGPNLGESGTRPKLLPDLSESGIGPEPVPDLGEVGIQSSHIFEDSLDDLFDNLDRVTDIDKDEGSDTPVVIAQTKPVQIP